MSLRHRGRQYDLSTGEIERLCHVVEGAFRQGRASDGFVVIVTDNDHRDGGVQPANGERRESPPVASPVTLPQGRWRVTNS